MLSDLLTTVYILTLTAISLYLIALTYWSGFIKSNEFEETMKSKGWEKILESLRSLLSATQGTAIAVVVINFFIIVAMIFKKVKISVRT